VTIRVPCHSCVRLARSAWALVSLSARLYVRYICMFAIAYPGRRTSNPAVDNPRIRIRIPLQRHQRPRAQLGQDVAGSTSNPRRFRFSWSMKHVESASTSSSCFGIPDPSRHGSNGTVYIPIPWAHRATELCTHSAVFFLFFFCCFPLAIRSIQEGARKLPVSPKTSPHIIPTMSRAYDTAYFRSVNLMHRFRSRAILSIYTLLRFCRWQSAPRAVASTGGVWRLAWLG